MIYLDDFPELEEIRKVISHEIRMEDRYGRTARGIDPELIEADLTLLSAIIKAQDEYISGAVG